MSDAHIRRIPSTEDGTSGTDWSRYSLDQIWHMVSTEDGRITYTQIDAWRRMALLCTEQADQLEKAMNQLLRHWPPRPGSASAAFSSKITALVLSMRRAAEAATANKEPLRNITNALTGARIEIDALLQTQRHYALAEQQLTPQPTPSPGQIPLPAAPAGVQPPPLSWRTQLEQQARTVMAHTDAAVGIEASRIQIPPEYIFQTSGVDIERPPPGGGRDGSESFGTTGIARPTFDLTDWSPPSTDSAPPLVAIKDMDPVLAGGTIPGTLPTNVPDGRGGIDGLVYGGATSGSFVTTPYGAVLAPGGTISAGTSKTAPETSSHSPATLTPTSAGAGSGTSGRTGAQGVSPMAPMVPPTGGRRGAGASGLPQAGRLGRGGRRNRSQTDPDDPWVVAEGGPAVLEPLAEPTGHDPGPGVIGLDR